MSVMRPRHEGPAPRHEGQGLLTRDLACRFTSSSLSRSQCEADENGEPTDNLSPQALAYCQRLGVTATKVSEIIANKEPAVYTAIQEAIERINARSTSNAQKVQKWVILDRDFSITGGELGE